VAGTIESITVTAKAADGSVASGYQGTVQFTSSDPHAALPTAYTFTAADHGVHTFNITLTTSQTQTVTVADVGSPQSNGHASSYVLPAPAARFAIIGAPSTIAHGVPFTFTVEAFDQYGNVSFHYNGTIHFTSTDPLAILPNDYTFVEADHGGHHFTATLRSPGTAILIATDKARPSVKGTSATIRVT
jgi:hypothetical protein